MLAVKKISTLLAAATLALLVAPGAGAFWIIPPGHRQITREALGQVKALLPVDQVGFSEEAIDKILLANVVTDIEAVNPYLAREHYDNEQFRTGAAQTIRLRRDIVDALLKHDRVRAWTRLGRALHGIQDFYAHSSWIEQRGREGRPETATHYDRLAGSDRDRLRQFMSEIGDTPAAGCGSDGETLTAATGITSGYYPHTSISNPFSEEDDLPYPSAAANPTKCVHLGMTVVMSHCLLPIVPAVTLPGCRSFAFEKDNDNDALHTAAYDAAETASWRFIQDIVTELTELQTPEGYRAICHLFGQPAPLCMQPAAALLDGVYRVRQLCVYSIPAYTHRVVVSTSGVRRTLLESEQPQHVCLDTSSTFVSPGTLFCRKDGVWIRKSTTWSEVGSSADNTRYSMSVTEDGTFAGTYVRVLRSTSPTSEVIHDFKYYAKANASTHATDAYLYKKDSTWTSANGSDTHEWYGMGRSTIVPAQGGHGIDLRPYASFVPDQPLPDYCSR